MEEIRRELINEVKKGFGTGRSSEEILNCRMQRTNL